MLKYLLTLFVAGNFVYLQAANDLAITFHISVANTVPGHDFLSKFVIKMDGKLVGETKPQNQSIPTTYTIVVPRGIHEFKVEFMGNINGLWDERTGSNDYSGEGESGICYVWKRPYYVEKDSTFYVLFDLEERDYLIGGQPYPQSANVFSQKLPKPYKYANKHVSFEQLKEKEIKVNEYLKANANKQIEVAYFGREFRIGTGGTNFAHANPRDLKDTLIQTAKGVEFQCIEKGLSACWMANATLNHYGYEAIKPNDLSKMDELHQILSDFYADFQAYYWREFATKDDTPEDILVFDLQKKFDKLNKAFSSHYKEQYDGIEYQNDTLVFRKLNGEELRVKYADIWAIEADSMTTVVAIFCINNGCFYNTATNNYEDKIVFPPTRDFLYARLFFTFFVTFYNSVADYHNFIDKQSFVSPLQKVKERKYAKPDPGGDDEELDRILGN